MGPNLVYASHPRTFRYAWKSTKPTPTSGQALQNNEAMLRLGLVKEKHTQNDKIKQVVSNSKIIIWLVVVGRRILDLLKSSPTPRSHGQRSQEEGSCEQQTIDACLSSGQPIGCTSSWNHPVYPRVAKHQKVAPKIAPVPTIAYVLKKNVIQSFFKYQPAATWPPNDHEIGTPQSQKLQQAEPWPWTIGTSDVLVARNHPGVPHTSSGTR